MTKSITVNNAEYTFHVNEMEYTIACHDANNSVVYKVYGYEDADPLICMPGKNCLTLSTITNIMQKVDELIWGLVQVKNV